MSVDAARGRARRAAWQKRRRRLIAYGRWSPTVMVDPGPAREHLARLRTDHALSVDALAELTGQTTSTIAALLYPGHAAARTWVTAATADAILSARYDPGSLHPGRRVSSVGTRRRLQALAVDGWSLSEVARRRGTSVQALAQMMKRDRVAVSVACDVKDLYALLEGQPGPCTRARRRAAVLGWAPAEAWTPDTIEDPHAVPTLSDSVVDEVAVHRALSGQPVALTPGEVHETVAIGTARGISARALAARVGVDERTVARIRTRLRQHGHPGHPGHPGDLEGRDLDDEAGVDVDREAAS